MNNNNIILSRFYDAYYLIIADKASTTYQSTKWSPKPLKNIPNKPRHFDFDCYGMFFSWIFRDKLEHIKKELMYIWKKEALLNNYSTKYGDLLWFAYLLANVKQRDELIKNIFPSWNINNKYRDGTIRFSNSIFPNAKNIDYPNDKIKKGDILLWCNQFQNNKYQKYGHIIIALEKPKIIYPNRLLIKCGETTVNKNINGLQIKNRIFKINDDGLYYRDKLVIITRII